MSHKVHIPFDISTDPAVLLRAGMVSILLEEGKLRYLHWGGEEIVRMIMPAVRDEKWDTAGYDISDLVIDQGASAFEVSFNTLFSFEKPICRMEARIHCSADHALTFEVMIEAISDFMTNRTGVCALLPTQTCQGLEVLVTSTNGSIQHSRFPEEISPHQPIKNIKKLAWTTIGGTKVHLELEGDVFEMEDQRNWMDDSFKIYNRSLEQRFPYLVRKQDKIHQKVTIRIDGATSKADPSTSKIKIPMNTVILPDLGYQFRETLQHDLPEARRLPDLWSTHFRMELNMTMDWRKTWKEGLQWADQHGQLVDLVVLFSNEYEKETDDLLELMTDFPEVIYSLLPLRSDFEVTPAFLSHHLHSSIGERLQHVHLGYGTDRFFAELNRNRPDDTLPYDFVSFSLNPQIHLRDTRTLLENLFALPAIIDTVRTFTAKPIHISPLTLHRRAHPGRSGFLNVEHDPRSATNFELGWYLLAIFFLGGVERISYLLPSPVEMEHPLLQSKAFHGILNNRDDHPISVSLNQLDGFICLKFIPKPREEHTFHLDEGFLDYKKIQSKHLAGKISSIVRGQINRGRS